MSETPANKKSCLKCCLIVSGILACLFLVFCFVYVPYAREEARRMQCSNNCKMLALNLINYQSVYGSLPPAYTVDENGKPLHSWRVLLLPFMYQQRMYSEIRFDEPWDSEHNRQFHDRIPSEFICPGCKARNEKNSYTNYLRIVGAGTLTNGPDTVLLDQVDNKESTILLVESTRPVCWMAPEDLAFEDFNLGTNSPLPKPEDIGFRSFHPNRINIVMCDGSVLSVANDTPIQFLAAAARVQMKKDE